MRKIILSLLTVLNMLPAPRVTAEDAPPQVPPAPAIIAPARRMIASGEAECVLMRSGEIIASERGRGVSPLLTLFDRRATAMAGADVVDKVIGRAAAFIAIAGKAATVHGEIMSAEAYALLRENRIPATCSLLVPQILNRRRNGLCPLEQSVIGCTDPAAAMLALRKRIKELQNNSRTIIKEEKK